MPLDYSKWDKLELSDDEDIEVHPNVDHKSFVRWKQEAIHRDRRDRKDKIAALEMEKTLNDALLKDLAASTPTSNGNGSTPTELAEKYLKLQEKQKEDIFKMRFTDRNEHWGAPVPDEFVEKRVDYTVLKEVGTDPAKLAAVVAGLEKRQTDVEAEIKKEVTEQNKKITSENWGKVGFDKTVVNKTEVAPPPEPPKETRKKTVTSVETLNEPKAPTASPAAPAPAPEEELMDEDEEEEDEDGVKLTDPAVAKFAAAKSMDESFSIIQKYPYLVSEKIADEIMAAAFSAQYRSKTGVDVKQMVVQSTILSYCLKLSMGGKDGVALFFKRVADDTRGPAFQGFMEDATKVYERIMERTKVLQENDAKERAEAQKRLQARFDAAKQADGSLKWPVGPNPTEEDEERVRVFAEFPEKLQVGLLLEDVDAINEHLATLSREEGEALLEKIGQGGFLNMVGNADEEEDDE